MSSVRFRISGLPLEPFLSWFGLSDHQLVEQGAKREVCDSAFGFPCRVSLVDAGVGETVILLPYQHHPVNGPYQASGPIFVRESAQPASLGVNEVPDVVRLRLMSLRAYDANGAMIASEVIEGREIEKQIEVFFANDQISYIHLHNARAGCYSCRVDRA